ncbi:Uncharacterised protein [Mycobacteroides abscessus subsp. abscessus]|nr:Uncharacterised protein [Mycobacteroides abscessus subsp. abscessus]
MIAIVIAELAAATTHGGGCVSQLCAAPNPW